MRKFGLIGYPLGHSFSQKYFTEKFISEGITDCSYQNFPIASISEFPDLVESVPDLCGLNVTIPYKTEILKFVSLSSPEVTQIGATNVLKIRRSGEKTEVIAYNSDIKGIEDSLRPVISDKVKSALILGTGGSSLAVKYVLKKLHIEFTLVSRHKRKDTITYKDLTNDILSKNLLIVNTTPLGMYPDVMSQPDLDYSLLGENHILFDLVYNPEMTTFLKKGNERGCKIVTGLKMLYSQAERSWEIWNDNNL